MGKKHSEGFLQVVNACKERIHETNCDEVKNRMDNGDEFILVDCREDDEWNAGHIVNSIHIGKGVMERDIEDKIPDKTKEIVIYCGGGFRSAIAAAALQDMGYSKVSSMDGGIRTWKEKNYPLA